MNILIEMRHVLAIIYANGQVFMKFVHKSKGMLL